MSAKRLLRGQLPRLFRDHRGRLARSYRAEFERLLREAGPGASEEVRRAAVDAAECWVRKEVASRTWALTAEARLSGRGRRPTEARLRAASKRAALDAESYRQALVEFKALLVGRNGHRVPTPAEVLEQMTGDGRG